MRNVFEDCSAFVRGKLVHSPKNMHTVTDVHVYTPSPSAKQALAIAGAAHGVKSYYGCTNAHRMASTLFAGVLKGLSPKQMCSLKTSSTPAVDRLGHTAFLRLGFSQIRLAERRGHHKSLEPAGWCVESFGAPSLRLHSGDYKKQSSARYYAPSYSRIYRIYRIYARKSRYVARR